MRRFTMPLVSLTLLGCANLQRPAYVQGGPPAPDSESMRVVMHQPISIDPLLPEPGNVWADLTPYRPASMPIRQAQKTQQAPQPPTRAAGAAPMRAAASAAASPPSTIGPSSTARSPPHPSVATPSPAAPPHFAAQLTAANSQAAALTQWQRLQNSVPTLFDGRVPVVAMAEIGGRSVWRLRTGGFANRADADAFCTRLQAEHAPCWVVAGTS
jgi:hypothetical protein